MRIPSTSLEIAPTFGALLIGFLASGIFWSVGFTIYAAATGLETRNYSQFLMQEVGPELHYLTKPQASFTSFRGTLEDEEPKRAKPNMCLRARTPSGVATNRGCRGQP
ncbi:MAG TPA: hypothetical protein VEA36_00055 [Candidatus Paceibacterota bacterium]|nr:hypothetical protein [Candidatus Paceibacterota bacterium]